MIPKNCSVGTRSFCVGFATSVNCSSLPLNISRLIAGTSPALNSPPLESGLAAIDQELKYVTPGLIEGPIILGIVSAVILLILLVIRSLFWSKESFYRLWTVPVDAVIGVIGFVICLACSIYLPIELRRITTHVEHSNKVVKGNLMSGSICILCFALIMAVCLASVYVRNYILPGMKTKTRRTDRRPQRDPWAPRAQNYAPSGNPDYPSPYPPQPSHIFT